MSDSDPRPPVPSPTQWSSRLAERYRLELTECLIDWFDRERFKLKGFSEFSTPIHPEDLLTEAPEPIWPALMCCDMIPIIGNQAGDYLCARVGPENTVIEFVQWYHGGGDWIPWGGRLPEAVLFDAVRHKLPGPHHRHAEPAESVATPRSTDLQQDPIVRWAIARLPAETAAAFSAAISNIEPVISLGESLLQNDVATAAVQFEMMEDALFPTSGEPDYSRAESIALRTIGGRQDGLEPLSWTWNVAAIAAHQRGSLELAMDRFGRSLLCSNFSDQSVRLRHVWKQAENAKFASWNLHQLMHGNTPIDFDERQLLLMNLYSSDDIDQRGQAVTDYWIDCSLTREREGDFAAAYDCMVRAGWDLGAAPMRAYEDILRQAARLADLAGQNARAAVASTHLACFHDRYGKQ